MKMESQKQQEHVFFLATENIFIHVNKPFRIQHEMIESRNFIPEALMIQQIQESKRAEIDCNSFLKVTRGEKLMAGLESELWKMEDELLDQKFLSLADEDEEDNDEEDWDEEDEDWDEEDEDWDDEDEDWDEEDEDWDDEDELDDDDDEEEDWDEDEEEEE
ncbi:hypothetical protein L0244_11055 [bacterium]|nr:hypothetical protein [bacterium]MCI0613514.1 hypothetical protein [bacterium]